MKRRRRRMQVAGDDVVRALEIANQRIVEVEMAHAATLAALDRAVTSHWYGCTHAQQLSDALWQLTDCRRSQTFTDGRLRNALAMLHDINASVTEPMESVAAAPAPTSEECP